MEKVKLLVQDKYKTKEGDLIEIKVWKIPKSKEFPDEVKYSLAFIHKGERLVGYDNEKTKGYHKHIKNQEIKIEFKNYNQIMENFEKDVKNIQKELYGGKNGNKN